MIEGVGRVGSMDSPKSGELWHNSLAGSAFFTDWAFPDTSPTVTEVVDEMLPVENWLISSTSPSANSDSGPTEIQKVDAVFQSLSAIHARLRALRDIWTKQGPDVDFVTFYCAPKRGYTPVEAIQAMFAMAQEFLGVLKALHRRGSTAASKAKAKDYFEQPRKTQMPWACTLMLTHLHLQAEADPSSDDTEEATSDPIIDLSTASVVISSYSHLLTVIEKCFAMKHARLIGFLNGPVRSNLAFPNMKFADIPLVEVGLQGVLFSEGILHLLNQINLLLGVPNRWTRRCCWTGLLSSPRYRALLNKELGLVQGSWSTRPMQVQEIVIMTKDVVQELAVLGYS
ncbi:hypothetical protein HJFPF1_00398 [Paramyrothecium foliicola]|nr:hypothetical protein HJFPF1_00398 [Paramyrothecium foliicola]